MSNYTKSTNFATKDNLTPGDPLKVVRGTEIDTEYNNIATAVATKTDNASAAITGGAIDGATVGATTPATGSFTTLAASGTTTLAGALVGAATQAAFNTVSTTLNLGGAATAVNLGAATGTATVNNTTLAAKAITASTTLAVTGTSTLTGAVTATAGVSGPITSSSVSITGGSITGITDLAVADGGTGASTAATALNNLLPSQTGNSSKYLQTDGTNATWDAVSLSTADITGTLGAANGGTGVANNAASTLAISGAFATTLTVSGTTGVTLPTTGTLATLAGTETLTNKTLTSPILTTPNLGVATGTSFQGIIGNVTPAAGNFTTLGASSTATLNTLSSSGATLTGGTINGMTVGATTASTGAFTTLTTSSTVTHNGGTANGVTYLNGSKVLTSGSALTFDGSKLTVNSNSTTTAGFFQVNDGTTTQANSFGSVVRNSNDGNGRYSLGAFTVQNASGLSQYGYIGAQSVTGASNYTPELVFGLSTGASTYAEQMRLTTTGLGIGTSSPSAKLHIFNGASTADQILEGGGSNNGANLYFYADISGSGNKYRSAISGINASGSALTFSTTTNGNTAPTERARIDSSGNLLVGTTSLLPGSPTRGNFYNAGSASAVVGVQNAQNVSGDVVNAWFIGSNANNTSSYFLQCGVVGVANVFYIYGNGNVQNTNNSYGAISDVKLKENIVDATPKLADLMQVKVRNYNLIGSTTKQIGVVAQELETIFPAMVDETPDRDAENNVLETTTKSVKYSVFVPMLIKALQEQQALIQSLKARLDAANL